MERGRGVGQSLSLRTQAPIVAVALGITSLVNFTYQLLVATWLDPVAYGLFASLLVVVATVGAAASGLQVLSARSVSTGINWDTKPGFFDNATRQALLVGLLLAVGGLLAAPSLAHLLGTSTAIVAILVFAFPIFLLQALILGRIQGTGAIYVVALIGLGVASFKVLSGAAAVSAGGGLTSLILLLLLANGLAIPLGARRASRAGQVDQSLFSTSTAVVVFAQAAFWFLASLDVFYARIGLPDVDAGVFAAAATIAKSVLFLPGLITAFVLPKAGRLFGDRRARVALGRTAIVLTAAVTVLCAAGVALIGPAVLRVVLGSEYQSGATYVGLLAFAYIPIALSGVVLQFHFTSQRWIYVVTTLIVLVLAILAVIAVGSSATSYAMVMAGAGSMLLLLLLLESMYPAARQRALFPPK